MPQNWDKMSQAANSKVDLFGNGFTNASDAKTVLWTAAFTTLF